MSDNVPVTTWTIPHRPRPDGSAILAQDDPSSPSDGRLDGMVSQAGSEAVEGLPDEAKGPGRFPPSWLG